MEILISFTNKKKRLELPYGKRNGSNYSHNYYLKNRQKFLGYSSAYYQVHKLSKEFGFIVDKSSEEQKNLKKNLSLLQQPQSKEKTKIRKKKWWDSNKEIFNFKRRKNYLTLSSEIPLKSPNALSHKGLNQNSLTLSSGSSLSHTQTHAGLTVSIPNVVNQGIIKMPVVSGVVPREKKRKEKEKKLGEVKNTSLLLSNSLLLNPSLETKEKEVTNTLSYKPLNLNLNQKKFPRLRQVVNQNLKDNLSKDDNSSLGSKPQRIKKRRYEELVDAIRPSELRLCKVKNPGDVYGKGWDKKSYLEKRSVRQIRKMIATNSNYCDGFGSIGGGKVGNYFNTWVDFDPQSAPTVAWQNRLIKNWKQGVEKDNVIYGTTPTSSGGRMAVWTCCQIESATFWHASKWKNNRYKNSKNVKDGKVKCGGLRGKKMFTVIEGKGRTWFAEKGEIAKKFKCSLGSSKNSKDCHRQLEEWLKNYFFLEVKWAKVKEEIKEKKECLIGFSECFTKKIIFYYYKDLESGRDDCDLHFVNGWDPWEKKKFSFIFNSYNREKEWEFVKNNERKMLEFLLRNGESLVFCERTLDFEKYG